MWAFMHRLASPPHFYRLAGRIKPWTAGLGVILMLIGAYGGLVLAPPDYQQGDGFRIIYVHVPSAWLSLMGYTSLAVASAIGLVWRIKLAHLVAHAIAPIGAAFTFLALATGSLWGKPMWGTWWVWDARLTSELILLFLYLGYGALAGAFEDVRRGDRAAALLAIVGVVNVPIIHYSVYWWHTLHQGATVTRFGSPHITWNMLWPLLVMALGFTLWFATIVLTRTQSLVLQRERQSRWVKEYFVKS